MPAQLLVQSNPDSARPGRTPAPRTVWIAGAGAAMCTGLVAWGAHPPLHGLIWPRAFDDPLRLTVAALIGLVVTAVHRRSAPSQAPAMQHAQILLCVSGAMMMVLIHDSLARAFGIAGAASLIRFRTPVDDPRDAAVLFLLLALGMASGLGAFTLAGSGTALLCLFLLLLSRLPQQTTRALAVELTARGGDFPLAQVYRVFTRHGVTIEIREISQGDTASAKYLATCPSGTSLEALNADLLNAPVGLRAIAWEPARKKVL